MSKGNKSLNKAIKNKNDEFYTQLSDITEELKNYKKHFKGKVVLCNCDDPRESNFFHYFSYNFEHLQLKKLIAVCYKSKDKQFFSKYNSKNGIYQIYEGDKNGNRVPDDEEIDRKSLKGDGDFRSDEGIELLKQADIVVTNPPFSLFREYVAQLIEYEKQFLIIGSMNSISYKEIFPLLKDNKLWLGVNNGVKRYNVPKNYESKKYQINNQGDKFVTMGNTGWFTNLSHKKRNDELYLSAKYKKNESYYPKYDNYDAIEVGYVKDIPSDYVGVMGVPVTFIDKFCPEQFEIVGMAEDNAKGFSGGIWDGKNKRCVINGENKFKRIFIKNKG